MHHSLEPLRWRDIRAVYQLEQDIFPKDAYPYFDLITVGVNRHFQRQGIATRLLQAAERVLRARRLRLTVRAGNRAAINLYEKMGYTLVYSHQRYYRDGEDGLVMEKTITS